MRVALATVARPTGVGGYGDIACGLVLWCKTAQELKGLLQNSTELSTILVSESHSHTFPECADASVRVPNELLDATRIYLRRKGTNYDGWEALLLKWAAW